MDFLKNDTVLKIIKEYLFDGTIKDVAEVKALVADDEELMLELISRNNVFINYCSSSLLKDKDFAMKLIDINPMLLKHADISIRANASVMLSATKKNPDAFSLIPTEELNNQTFVKQIFFPDDKIANGVDYKLFKDVSSQLRSNASFMIELIKKNDKLFEYISPSLLKDKNFMDKYFEIKKENVMKVMKELPTKKDLLSDLDLCRSLYCYGEKIMSKLEKLANVMKDTPINNDREFVLSLVEQYPPTLQFASEELRSDKSFMLDAFQKCKDFYMRPCAYLVYNSNYFIGDLVHNFNIVYNKATEQLKNDNSFIFDLANEYSDCETEAEKACSGYYRYIQPEYIVTYMTMEKHKLLRKEIGRRDSEDFILEVASKCDYIYMPDKLLENKDFMLRALYQDIRFASILYENRSKLLNDKSKLLNDKDFSLHLIEAYSLAEEAQKFPQEYLDGILAQIKRCIKDSFRDDADFMNEATTILPKMGSLLSYRLQEDAVFMTGLVKKNHELAQYASEDLRKNPQVMADFADINLTTLNYSMDSLKGNRDFALEMLKKTSKALKYFSPKLIKDYTFVIDALKINPTIAGVLEELDPRKKEKEAKNNSEKDKQGSDKQEDNFLSEDEEKLPNIEDNY